MRIFEAAQPSIDRKADVEHVIERTLHSTDGSPRRVVVEMILHRLGGAGYVLAHKDDMPAREPIEIKLPEGSIHGYYLGEAHKVGTVALLTPEGERLVSAFASKDWSGISDRDYRRFIGLVDRVLEGDTTSAQIRELALRIVNKADPETLDAMRRATYATAERPITPEDFTGPVTLEPGKIEEGQESATDLARRVDPAWCYRNGPVYRARHDQAVRDCLEASRLTYAAAEVIGHAAVSEILTSAEPPANDAGEAA